MQEFLRGLLEERFVAEYAVEGGAADSELAGCAELVAAIEVEDVLDVMADDSVEREVFRLAGRLLVELNLRFGGQGKIAGEDDAVIGFEEGGFKDASELADVAGPVVLEEPRERAGAEDDGALLIAEADAVEQRLGEWGNIFAALTQRRNSETDGGETEGEVGK